MPARSAALLIAATVSFAACTADEAGPTAVSREPTPTAAPVAPSVPAASDGASAQSEGAAEPATDDGAGVGGGAGFAPPCWLEEIAVTVVGDAYLAETGARPADLAALVDFGLESVDLAHFRLDGNFEFVQVSDDPCLVEPLADMFVGSPDVCSVDAAELTIAAGVYEVARGTLPAGHDELVAIGYLAERSRVYLLEDQSALVTVPGSGCPDLGDPQAGTEHCDVQRKTFSVATEAFIAVYGENPTSMQELVDSGMLMTVPDDWRLVAADQVGDVTFEPLPGSLCDGT